MSQPTGVHSTPRLLFERRAGLYSVCIKSMLYTFTLAVAFMSVIYRVCNCLKEMKLFMSFILLFILLIFTGKIEKTCSTLLTRAHFDKIFWQCYAGEAI